MENRNKGGWVHLLRPSTGLSGALVGMLRKIKVRPLAFESFGVRSMCTFVETPDVKILLDAGVALGPRRFGLPPHPREYKALKERREIIIEAAGQADVVTVSHYHFDHHTPSFTDWANLWSSAETSERIYGGKIIFAKSFKSMINFSQRRRGWLFRKMGGRAAARLEYADGRSFRFGGTTLRFSSPVFHGGEGSELGWVLLTIIEHGDEKVLYAPDVQGPASDGTLKVILGESVSMAIIGGPPLYLRDFRVSRETIEHALKNLAVISSHVPLVILDHHVLRTEDWREHLGSVFESSMDAGHRVLTAAEYAGKPLSLLEASRRALFDSDPPSREFIRWTRLPMRRRKLIKPPI